MSHKARPVHTLPVMDRSALYLAITTSLHSGDQEFETLALARLRLVIVRCGGNLCTVARELGVPLRTVQRWHEHAGVRAIVKAARDSSVIAATAGNHTAIPETASTV